MKLATRTGLAALGASVLAVMVLANVVARQFEDALNDRVDDALDERAAASAAVLVAVGDRISVSELNAVIDSARVVTDPGTEGERVVEVGPQPVGGLPPVSGPGIRTVDVGGDSWRILTRTVEDVPEVGDRAVVAFAEPLGPVEERISQVRRRVIVGGLAAALGAGAIGWLFGRRAARPLTLLRGDAAAVGEGGALAVADGYGTPEVDDVAAALNTSLADLAAALERRDHALASARDFAASATHELRTPLQSAMTNLDVALAEDVASASPVRTARGELDRMATSLATVHALSQADLARAEWFEEMDLDALADLVDEVAARYGDVDLELDVVPSPGSTTTFAIWADGVRLALDNVVRNAVTHGHPGDGRRGRVAIRVGVEYGGGSAVPVVSVGDDGPGIAADDRDRVVAPFERASSRVAGSGLGLAVADRVAAAHGGRLRIDRSSLGGAEVTLELARPPTAR